MKNLILFPFFVAFLISVAGVAFSIRILEWAFGDSF